jgi:hypothetical protein
MDDCIEAQCGLYEYMRKILDYNIIIIPLTPPQMQRDGMTLHLKSSQNVTTKTKLIDLKSKKQRYRQSL